MNYASLSILMNSTRRLMTSLPYMQDEGSPSRSTLDLVAADVQTWRWDRPTSSLATSSRLGRSLSWKSLPLLNAIIGTTPSWSRDWIRNAGLLLWNSLPSNSVKDSSLKKLEIDVERSVKNIMRGEIHICRWRQYHGYLWITRLVQNQCNTRVRIGYWKS